jgi:hypothetical protein
MNITIPAQALAMIDAAINAPHSQATRATLDKIAKRFTPLVDLAIESVTIDQSGRITLGPLS